MKKVCWSDGCNEEATLIDVQGRWCCSQHVSQCSYWDRAQLRNADMTGFGYTPPMGKEELRRWAEEDRKDPPCGKCDACKESDRIDGDADCPF